MQPDTEPYCSSYITTTGWKMKGLGIPRRASVESVGIGIGSTMQADGQPGCRPKDGAVFEILAAERDFREQRADCRRKSKLVAIKRSFTRSFAVSSARLSHTGAKLSGRYHIPESTVTAALNDYVKLFLRL